MLDAKEQGAQRPEESTIIPFSESRYRSSRRKGALTDGRSPSFISAPSGGYSSLYFASQSRSASTAFVRTKCGTHVLDGDTPYPVIRTKDSVYNGNLWRVPITAQSSTNATDHDALQPRERERSGLCPLAHPSIHPITPATSESAAGAPRLKRWGEAPFSINDKGSAGFARVFKKDKRREEYHQTRMVKPFSLNSHRTIYGVTV